ncbi:MAG: SpoIIE family protein phosphatase [Oscillospiraceae bacterium]|nr:SpoIIE family protein phosphatase [Oscillospiraceae bacterium]
MIKKIRLWICMALVAVLLAQTGTMAFGTDDGAKADNPEEVSPDIVDPIGNSDSYSAVLYNNTNGLPTSEMNAIAETGDGFIWIGGYSGLIRYDGNTFVRVDSATTGITSVVCLHVDRQNRLWIGTNDNGLAMMERGSIQKWGEAEGLRSAKICDIAEDDNGLIYVGTTLGVVTIDQDMQIHESDDERISSVYVEMLRRGSDGLIYGVSSHDDIFTLRDGEPVSFLSHEEGGFPGCLSILPDRDHSGCIYMGTETSEVLYCSVDSDLKILKEFDVSPLSNIMNLDLIGDRIWISARNGIGVLDGDEVQQFENIPMDNSIVHAMADYEGNLWFCSTRQGVMKIVPNRFSDLFERYDLPRRVVNTTCLYDGLLFAGTDTGLIVLDENGPVSEMPLQQAVTAGGEQMEATDLLELLDGCRIRSILHDSKGNIWISTWRACGLLRYDGEKVTAFTEADGLLSDHVRAVCEREDGSFLVVNSGGVSIIEGDRVIRSYGKEDGILNVESLTVSWAENGDILLGSNGGGIYVINEEGTKCIGSENGLSSGIVMRIKRDPERHVFWLVTSNSIAYMTEDYQVTTIQKFPYSNNFDLYDNGRGDMWILSSNGIYVLPVQELLANGDVNPVHYTLANGMPCIATSNSYSELTADGDLYIAGNTGIAKINIETPLENIQQLKVTVPYVEADGVRLYPNEHGIFAVPAGTQKLTVYGYVFNYSLTDPLVSYSLTGFDRESVTVRRSEFGPVNYTNLPGGTYQFEIQLKDALGHEDKTTSVTISKAKSLHEQGWFYIMLGLATILLVSELNILYMRKKTQDLEKKQKEAVRQERLNTELHTARKIQSSMMPQTFPPYPDRSEFEIYALMDPAREVGGDFYDFFLIDDDHLCMVIADVSGKGIPASLFMMISKVILQSCAMLGQSAAEILNKTNEALCSNNQVEMFVTVWIGILEISTGRITAANAGHEYPALMKQGRFALLKDKHGLVIGGMEGSKYRDYEIVLEPGDKLFVYTDGVPEAMDTDNTLFGTERMLNALNEEPDAAPEKILRNVHQAVDDFVKDAEQFDDVTMLCLEYKGKKKET